MTVWTRLKEELDRAGRAAQGALDEGKTRLELLRTRQLADKAAQAIGYAVFRARVAGRELEAEIYQRLSTTLASHEAEVARLDGLIKAMKEARAADRTETAQEAEGAATGAAADGSP